MATKGFVRAPCVTKLVVFDFDHTLSAYHVYYALAGGNSGGLLVPPPYGITERGQLARLIQLEKSPEYSDGFCMAAMGGPTRVHNLRVLLTEMRYSRIECIICSRGLVGVIRYILLKTGLLRYFTEIHANNTRMPDVDGTPFDRLVDSMAFDTMEEACLAKYPETLWRSKADLIKLLMASRGLTHNEVIFIDDTQSEIESVRGVCVSIEIMHKTGITHVHEEEFRNYMRRVLPRPLEGYGPFHSPRAAPELQIKYGDGSICLDNTYNKCLAEQYGPVLPEIALERRIGLDIEEALEPAFFPIAPAPSLLTADRKSNAYGYGHQAGRGDFGFGGFGKPSEKSLPTTTTTVPSSTKEDAAWSAAQSITAAPAPPPPPQRLARGLEEESPRGGGPDEGSFIYLGTRGHRVELEDDEQPVTAAATSSRCSSDAASDAAEQTAMAPLSMKPLTPESLGCFVP
eukprot:CAMPEP_0206603958 /NCGR_PEP_ID=MMETSP0325_2-20121206/48949_1 /ASSEMBLY_ACC=CAM_ASM_000347 /TAXON_ID=2866 /ORGANISM="Crypthecodinium cohnii, Strain Seligo" /LENGTH=456 /DNA_ID=CAMNT_0054118049 /DNA_START=62 /DNA_END=1430 /DNA_ORIENTATION=-